MSAKIVRAPRKPVSRYYKTHKGKPMSRNRKQRTTWRKRPNQTTKRK